MVDLNPNINILGINTPIKRQIGYIKKDPSTCCLQETHFRLKVNGYKKTYHANTT